MKHTAYIGLGSNIENRMEYLEIAVKTLHQHSEINVVNTSSIYETDPIGYEEQALFLNMVVQVTTNLNPFDLLKVCLNIENKLGRKRDIRWGPRTIDLDILLYNHENIKTEELIIPHPRMDNRAFVIVPLLEIKQSSKLPIAEDPFIIKEENKLNKEGVRIWKQKNGEDVFALFEN
ncbi:2-amino-4-hydroxy-6-hydroxymethyldihydropteridine diphosphokinase [Bacillus aquiflavi]|uniref:2-amino-4-hydroxy-6-hydroxymethyldihydropteridine diphosphokinase n=1 Tax=Bacillus aquiflavi TaxID=2672567 RepID=A0A6B3VXZ0_9BACI|nr:2-amino-4-hydroxy-6-hydroxymethyldihydropteridine diphosphokinase [Bacillus aquiflavi]MBA4538779.1 2-amino-4-hydroxy-6-hydroxymethyldihydropteridine diphosphokinase [Bacillus aquiflavi]NEY83130.1 2-amino-4-hydroxy-6-hydroxymethyldihydropteridine diphosphokinase [Bacillus aquiflavi]UAC48248.1 2-amino-4-hydroxy-6-hydroxymethyldihydropteridine diphosphokinase [Bacillus aquiflavi]